MTLEIVIVLGLVFVAVILFATEKLPIDLIALIIMATLLGSGIISLEEGLSGFSNPATVTIGAMFVLSAGLFKTGAVNAVGNILTRLCRQNFALALLAVMVVIGGISAFINNTAAVAIFLPIILGVAGLPLLKNVMWPSNYLSFWKTDVLYSYHTTWKWASM